MGTQRIIMPDPISFDCLNYQRADNGVVFITIDVKDRPVNVLTPELHRALGEVAVYLAGDEACFSDAAWLATPTESLVCRIML